MKVEMKRDRRAILITTLGILLFVMNDLHGQFGVKIGVSLSGLLSSNADDFRPFLGHEVEWIQYGASRPVLGIQFGIFYTINISDCFDLQPGIYLNQRGYWFDQTPLYDTKYVIRINYLEFPLVVRTKVPITSFDFNVSAGPFFSIKLNANRLLVFEGNQDIETLDCVKDFDCGILMGLGSQFDVGEGQMLVDLQLKLGLSSMLSQPVDYISLYDDPGRVKNFSLTLNTGYRFGNGGRKRGSE